MQTFSVRHALSCPNGRLVIVRTNEIRSEIIQLTRKGLYPNCIRVEPLIHLGHRISEEEVRHRGSVPETWGGMSIRGL